MTLKEAIKKQNSDFLYIGSGSSFIWIGHKEDAIDEMQKANDFYYTNLRDHTIPKAKKMLCFLDQQSVDGLMNDIHVLKHEELNIPKKIKKNGQKVKRIEKNIDKKNESMKTMSENQAKEHLKRIEELESEFKTMSEAQAKEHLKSIRKLEAEYKKLQKETTKEHLKSIRKLESEIKALQKENAIYENKLKKMPQKLKQLERMIERLPIQKARLQTFIAEKEEYLANWTNFLERTVVDIRPHDLIEPYGTIIVTEGNENGMYWFYEEVLADKRW